MDNKVFESYPVPKAVATLALPTVLSMLVTIFYNMADTFFVGQTGDPNQVAAVSLTTPVFMLLMAVGNIFGIGGCSYISRMLGEGDRKGKEDQQFLLLWQYHSRRHHDDRLSGRNAGYSETDRMQSQHRRIRAELSDLYRSGICLCRNLHGL